MVSVGRGITVECIKGCYQGINRSALCVRAKQFRVGWYSLRSRGEHCIVEIECCCACERSDLGCISDVNGGQNNGIEIEAAELPGRAAEPCTIVMDCNRRKRGPGQTRQISLEDPRCLRVPSRDSREFNKGYRGRRCRPSHHSYGEQRISNSFHRSPPPGSVHQARIVPSTNSLKKQFI